MIASFRPIRLRQQGVSIIELMIGVTLGLLLMAGLTVLFVNNNRTRAESEKTSQQIENGRYATQLLMEDIQQAGYYGVLNPANASPAPTPAAMPADVCADLGSAALKNDIALPIQGYHNVSATTLNCLGTTDVVAGSDIVVVRRTSSCIAGSAGCAAPNYGASTYFQAGQCPGDTGNYVIDTVAANFTLTKGAAVGSAPTCGTVAAGVADIRAFYIHIYFLTNNDQPGDGIPTLKMVELGSGAFSAAPLALVEGIQQMQVEYGIANIPVTAAAAYDGEPAAYTTDPGTYVNASTCGGGGCLPNWRSVTALKLHLLARNTQSTPGYTDTKTYVLGQTTIAAANDAYKRHAYTTIVRLNNVSGRLE